MTESGGNPKLSESLHPSSIAIIAGAGDFPILISRAAKSLGVKVLVFAISGFASETLPEIADEVIWVELGQVGKVMDLLREKDIQHVTLAGRVPHNSIFQYRHFDARALKILAKSITRKADGLLRAVTAEFESEGVRVMDSSHYLKSLMPQPGLITTHRPVSNEELDNIEFAYPIAKAVAGLDIGQTIVVKDKAVIAVEGLEGTDECICRAGQLAGPGCIVVKVSKPRQDMRFDVPVIGKGTLKTMVDARCSALAITAGESLLFDRDEVIALAEAANIAVTAVDPAVLNTANI